MPVTFKASHGGHRLAPAWATPCALALCLSACSHTAGRNVSTPPTPVAPASAPQAPLASAQTLDGQWAGRLSLKLAPWQGQSASGITLAFDLRSQADTGTLDLSTALGTQVARLSWQLQGHTQQAELETSEGRRQFGSLEALSQSVLGEALPLQALPHWLSGTPAPWLPHSAGTAPGHFEQEGWHVDASELTRGRLNLERPASDMQRGVTLRVRLDL